MATEAEGGERGKGKGDGGRRRRPCTVCASMDKRDAVVCGTCSRRKHLMCFFPPWETEAGPCVRCAPKERQGGERAEGEEAEAEAAGGARVWTCDECRSAPPALLSRPKIGDELEAEVEDSFGRGMLWKRAIVRKHVGRDRFVLMINPDEEDDFFEEYASRSRFA